MTLKEVRNAVSVTPLKLLILMELRMAKKSMMSEAADAVKSIAGAALGAAAVAATGIVVGRVSEAIRESGKKVEESAPELQKLASDTVTKPILPKKQKRAAATRKGKTVRKAKTLRKKVTTRKAAKKTRTAKSRKKR